MSHLPSYFILRQTSQANRKKNQEATGEKLSNFFLFQSISMAIQRGNAVCVMGCPKNRSSGLEGLFNFQVPETEVL